MLKHKILKQSKCLEWGDMITARYAQKGVSVICKIDDDNNNSTPIDTKLLCCNNLNSSSSDSYSDLPSLEFELSNSDDLVIIDDYNSNM